MNWFLSKLRSGAAGVLIGALLKPLASLAPGIAIFIFEGAWNFLVSAAFPVRALICSLVVACPALYLRHFLLSPISNGLFTSRYWLWFMSPLRRVSFDFRNYLGMGGGPKIPVMVYGLQGRLRANFRPAHITEAYLLSRVNGRRIDLLVDAGQNKNVPVAQVKEFPRGRWINFQAPCEPAESSKFLEEFKDFRLTIVLKGKLPHHIYFDALENDLLIKRFDTYSNAIATPPLELHVD